MEKRYEFIDKTLFFPKEGILVLGDLHLGYDYMLRQSGVLIPERQLKDIFSDIKKILKTIEGKKKKVNKIVFLGDITHNFGYEFQDRDEFLEIIDFLKTKIPEEDIIIIKGNHDSIDYSEGKMKEVHIESGIAFIHGHKPSLKIMDKKVSIIVSGHLHPSIILTENPGVKREAYKCFLEGSYKEKTFIVLPSFFGYIEGTAVNDYRDDYVESFSIIPRKNMLSANIYVIGEEKIYPFGKVKDL